MVVLKKGEAASVIRAITNRFNNAPDILPEHVGIVTAGNNHPNANNICIEFGGAIGEVAFERASWDNLRKVT